MNDADRVAEIKTAWDTLQPKWAHFSAAVGRAQDDLLFLIEAWERLNGANQGYAAALIRYRDENTRLRSAMRQWAEDDVLGEPLTATVEEVPALAAGDKKKK